MDSCVVQLRSAQTRRAGYVRLAELPRPASTPWNTFDLSSMGSSLPGPRLPARPRPDHLATRHAGRRQLHSPEVRPLCRGAPEISGRAADAWIHGRRGKTRAGEEARRTIWIGTSGWQYDSWRGRFYPRNLPKSGWLAFYAERFPTVEVNNSFYRLPSDAAFERWRDGTPPGFLIAPKVSRYLTHIRRLRDAAEPLELFWSRARALGPKLGPMLFQLPPTFAADEERLAAFLKLLPKRARSAVEFRHPSWDTVKTRSLLDAAGAALVLADRPGARVPGYVTGGWSYVRFHQGTRHAAGYPRAKIRRWADRLVELPATDVYVYFNNDPGGAAVRDARTLFDLLEGRGASLAAPSAASTENPEGGSR
jgi:uncharacterized protein YecE (DUF72 family)